MNLRLRLTGLACALAGLPGFAADLRDTVRTRLDADYPSLDALYKHLHANPELSFMEVNSAALIARELRALGCEVTEKVGITGVVGVLKNGPGPVVLVRADMDGLPIKEATGVPYASTAVVKDLAGRDQPAMHACAHDAHMTGFIGAARLLAGLKAHWSGTIVFVAQPAEEIGGGARAMLTDGLYTRFPTPDYALALHVWSHLPAGQIGTVGGPAYANVDSVDITVRGIGGHGSAPQTTKDPVVLAAEIVLALQTIVSREIAPGTPAVVTVGSIHGGSKRNIISDEVKLELTLRSYDTAVADHLVTSIKRIAENLGRAAGLPEDRLPIVATTEQRIPVVYNEPELTRRLASTFRTWFGEARTQTVMPTTGGEDFSEFGRTKQHVPLSIWWVGAADPAAVTEAARNGTALPSNHSALFAPVPEPTIKAAVTSMTSAVLDLLGKKTSS